MQVKKESNTMRVICKTCEAEWLIKASDLTKLPQDKLFDPIIFSYKCPCCGRKNYIGCKDLTTGIYCDLYK